MVSVGGGRWWEWLVLGGVVGVEFGFSEEGFRSEIFFHGGAFPECGLAGDDLLAAVEGDVGFGQALADGF